MSIEPLLTIQNNEQLNQLLQEQKTSILYFSSPDCNVCHALLPKVLKVAQVYKILVGQINTQEFKEGAGQLLVFTVPTLLVMCEGREILRESRFIDLQNTARILESVTEEMQVPSSIISLSNI